MNKKKLVALLTVSMFLLTLLPAAAMAEDAVTGSPVSVTGEVYENVYDSVYDNVYNDVNKAIKGWEFRGKLKVADTVYGSLTLVTKQGIKTFPVAANAQITFNGKKVTLAALKPGVEIGIKVVDGKITLIRASGPQNKQTPPGKVKKEIKKAVKKEVKKTVKKEIKKPVKKVVKKTVKKEVKKTVKKEVTKQKTNKQPTKVKGKK